MNNEDYNNDTFENTEEQTPSTEEEMDSLASDEEDETGEASEDGIDEGAEESDPGQDLKDGFGKDEFAKTLKDPNYYDKKDEELQNAYDGAKAEAQQDYKNRGEEDDDKEKSAQEDNSNNSADKPNQNNVDVAKDKSKGDNSNNSADKPNQNNADVAKDKSKEDNKGNNADIAKNKADPKKKNQLDRLKDKKNVANAKVNQIKNKANRAKAKAYEVNHPVEAAKAKAKAKVEEKVQEVKKKILKKMLDFFLKFPILCFIGIVILFVILLILLIIVGFSGGSGRGDANAELNVNDYLNVKVLIPTNRPDEVTYVDDYALSIIYTYFFVNEHNDDIKVKDENDNVDVNATKEALKNVYSAYYISMLTYTLSKGFSPTDREVEPDYDMEYCDAIAGCNISIWDSIIGYDNFHSTPDFSSDDPEDPDIPSLLDRILPDPEDIEKCEEDDEDCEEEEYEIYDYAEEAKILYDVYIELQRNIVVDKKYDGQLITKSSQIDYDKRLEVADIVSFSNDGYNYQEILISLYEDVDISSVDPDTSNLMIYSNEEYLQTQYDFAGGTSGNYDFMYVDQGFYWPIGSYVNDCYEKDGVTFCDGAPAFTYISSEFTNYRNLTNGAHYAIDITGDNATNAAVIAANDGVVNAAMCDRAGSCSLYGSPYYYNPGGCYILINHGDGINTLYYHLPVGSFEVQAGDTVKRGQKLATVGNTGCSTGAHLHFQVSVDGTPVNPHIYVSQTNPRSNGGE